MPPDLPEMTLTNPCRLAATAPPVPAPYRMTAKRARVSSHHPESSDKAGSFPRLPKWDERLRREQRSTASAALPAGYRDPETTGKSGGARLLRRAGRQVSGHPAKARGNNQRSNPLVSWSKAGFPKFGEKPGPARHFL